MIRPEHQFYIRPDLRKAASTKAESTTAESAIRPKQLVRDFTIHSTKQKKKHGGNTLQVSDGFLITC